MPFFIIIHFTMTIMSEPRLWLPVLPFLIASGLWAVLPEEYKANREQTVKPESNMLTRFPRTAYSALVAVFLVFFVGFFFFYKNAHMSDRDKKIRTENLVTTGRQYAAAQMTARAIEELNKAVVLDPENPAPHYELGIIYENSVYDYEKALFQFKETLRLDPYHLDKQRIENEIKRLEYTLKK